MFFFGLNSQIELDEIREKRGGERKNHLIFLRQVLQSKTFGTSVRKKKAQMRFFLSLVLMSLSILKPLLLTHSPHKEMIFCVRQPHRNRKC